MNLAQEDSSPWMLLIIGCLPGNTPYGMQQSQHYSSGQMISILRHSAVPLRGSTQPSSAVLCLAPAIVEEEILFGHFVTTLNDAFEWEVTSEDIRYKNVSKSLSVPTPLH